MYWWKALIVLAAQGTRAWLSWGFWFERDLSVVQFLQQHARLDQAGMEAFTDRRFNESLFLSISVSLCFSLCLSPHVPSLSFLNLSIFLCLISLCIFQFVFIILFSLPLFSISFCLVFCSLLTFLSLILPHPITSEGLHREKRVVQK